MCEWYGADGNSQESCYSPEENHLPEHYMFLSVIAVPLLHTSSLLMQ